MSREKWVYKESHCIFRNWCPCRVLSGRLPHILETDYCVAALEDALRLYGTPAIFNTDQGAQLTFLEFTGRLKEHSIQISTDDQGRWTDNTFIERLWWTLKYECVIKDGVDCYTTEISPSSMGGLTPDEVYQDNEPTVPGRTQAWSPDRTAARGSLASSTLSHRRTVQQMGSTATGLTTSYVKRLQRLIKWDRSNPNDLKKESMSTESHLTAV